MTDINSTHLARATPAGTKKPGPKGGILEPYNGYILQMAREGQSMQRIVNWLAESPRNVVISRQGVHCWIKARIKKLKKLKAAFTDTGIGGPFQFGSGVPTPQHLGQTTWLDPPKRGSSTSDSLRPLDANPTTKRIDARKFKVDANGLDKATNPFKRRE